MSYNLFIPEVQSALLLARSRRVLVFGQAPIVNRNWEGEISAQGDTVRIVAIGDVTIFDYVKGQDMAPAEQLTDADTALSITQAKAFNYGVSDVDKAIMKPQIMAEAQKSTVWGIGNKIDAYIAGFYTSAGVTFGSSGSPVTPAAASGTDANIGTSMYDYLVHLNTLMDQNDVEPNDRWAVINPWQKELLTQDKRFSSFNTASAVQVLKQGLSQAYGGSPMNNLIGLIDNLMVFWSNNAPHVSGTRGATGSIDVVLAGQSQAITFADGFTAMEAYRPQLRMEDAVKGVHLYGGKVVKPDHLVAAYFQHP